MNAISVYLIISIVITTFFSAYIVSSGKGDYIKVIFLLSLAMDFYMFGYLQELAVMSINKKLFWNCFQYLGIPFISALWLTVGLMYTNHFYHHLKIKLALIYAIPVLSFILRFTNNLHHLYFKSFQLQTFHDYSLLIKGAGIGYTIQGLHSGLLVFISLIVYLAAFIKSKDFDSEKSLYMMGASIIACVGLFLKIGGLSIDIMVLCLPIAMILVVMAIFRNDFLEITMLAKELVFERSKEGIILLNDKLKILDFNETAISIFKDHEMALEKEFLDAVVQKDSALNEILKSSASITWKAENANNVKYYEIITTDILHKNGTIYGEIKTFRDITKIKLRTNRLKIQATIDELSGLLNRREFLNSCQSYLDLNGSNEEPHYLIMFDIDYFKQINDTYGHIAGDHVIESFGSLIRQNFRTNDLIGRLGGEEFAVFMEAENIDSAYLKAENFRQAVEEWKIPFEENILKIAISIGIAEAKNSDRINDLINKADKALYVSKNSGRNKTNIYEKTLN